MKLYAHQMRLTAMMKPARGMALALGPSFGKSHMMINEALRTSRLSAFRESMSNLPGYEFELRVPHITRHGTGTPYISFPVWHPRMAKCGSHRRTRVKTTRTYRSSV